MGIPAGSIVAAATVAGVLNYVPELQLDAEDPATVVMVEQFLELVEPMVTTKVGASMRSLAAIGTTESAGVYAQFETAAAKLAEQGAASYVQDSRYPELAASRQTDQAWGAVLWTRFMDGLTTLADGVTAELDRLGIGVGGDLGVDLPDVSAPPPFFRDRQRW